MKRHPFLLLLAFSLFWTAAGPRAQAAATTNGASLFGLTNIWTLHLTFTAREWQGIGSRGVNKRNDFGGPPPDGPLDALLRGVFGGGNSDNGNRGGGGGGGGKGDDGSRYPWKHCRFEAGGQVFTNVAVRMKGVSSVARAPNMYKRPLKFDFNKDAKGRKFMDVEEFYLNNNVNDATQMREVLAYELFRRAGLPAPRTAFAQVYLTIPGKLEKQHLGLYTIVEAVEGDFLKRALGSKDGLLLKPEMMRGLQYFGGDWNNYVDRYQPKNEVKSADAARFMAFTRFLREASPEQFTDEVANYLDPDPFLRFVALNAILANVDSFIGNGHNYYLFQGSTNRKATFIPWDLNESFGMHPVSGPSGQQMKTSILRPNADPNPLVERFVTDPKYGPRYRELCAELLSNVFVPAKLHADIDRIAAVTKPVVFAETKRAKADFERTVLATMAPDAGDTRQPRFDPEFGRDGYRPWSFPDEVEVDNMPLKEWITGRHAHALDQLSGKVKGHRPRPRL